MGKKITVIIFLLLGAFTVTLIWQLNGILSNISRSLSYATSHHGKPRYRLAFIYQNTNTAFWKAVKQGAMEAAKRNHLFINFMEIVHGNDMGLSDDLRLAIEAGYDGIIIQGDDDQCVSLIQEASSNGIPTIMVSSDLPDSGRIGYVGTNSYRVGYVAGRIMLHQVEHISQPRLAILSPITESNLQMSVSESVKVFGFREAISFRRTIIPIWEKANDNPVDVMVAVRNLIRKYPDLNGIYATYSYGTLAAARIIEENGLVGKVTLIGHGDTSKIRKYIARGVITASIVEYPYRIGYVAVGEMVDYLHNGRVDFSNTIDTYILNRSNLTAE